MNRALAGIGIGVALVGLGGCSWFGGGTQHASTPPAQTGDNGMSIEQRMNALQTTLDQMRQEQHDEQVRQQQLQQQQQQQIQALEQRRALERSLAGTQGGPQATQPVAASAEANAAAPPPAPGDTSGPMGPAMSAVFPAFQWYDPAAPKQKVDPYGPDGRWKPD